MLYQDELLQRLQSLLQASLSSWGLHPSCEIKLLTFSENATYLVSDPVAQRRLVLRVHRPDYSNVDEIHSELAWIEALRASGAVSTAAPIPLANGERVARIRDGECTRFVAAFEFVPGQEPAVADDLPDWYRRLGRITARLHRHSRDWRRPPGFTRRIWTFDTIIGAG